MCSLAESCQEPLYFRCLLPSFTCVWCFVHLSSVSQRIHPPDVIGKYAPDSVIGMIGGGGGGGAVMAGAPAGGGGGGISMAEVAKHNSKSDCWVAWQSDFCYGCRNGSLCSSGSKLSTPQT